VERNEAALVVEAGDEGREAEFAAHCVGVGLDIVIGDGCGAGVFVTWLIAAGEDPVAKISAFFSGVDALGHGRRRGSACGWSGHEHFEGSDEAVGFVGD
jgi:hypothetical protein